MIDFNGFDKGVIGKKLPSDTTLNNMRKADLIDLLHIAEHNHKVLAEAYSIAVDNSKCNICPLGSRKAEHDKKIKAEAIDEFAEFLKKKHLLTNFHYHNGEADFDYADIDGYVNEFKNR